MTAPFVHALRVMNGLTAERERRLLHWMARRLPSGIHADHLTALAAFAMVGAAASYAAARHWPGALHLVNLCLLVNWFGDSLDGSLARWRQIERPNYGYFVDHSVDALATLLMVSAIGMSPYMRFDVALIAVIGYLLLAIHSFLAAKVVGEFRLSYMAGGPTELRLMLIAMTGLMPIVGGADVWHTNFSPFDLFGLTISSILVTLFVTQSFATARQLAHRRD